MQLILYKPDKQSNCQFGKKLLDLSNKRITDVIRPQIIVNEPKDIFLLPAHKTVSILSDIELRITLNNNILLSQVTDLAGRFEILWHKFWCIWRQDMRHSFPRSCRFICDYRWDVTAGLWCKWLCIRRERGTRTLTSTIHRIQGRMYLNKHTTQLKIKKQNM